MFGVVGIDLSEKPLDAFENSVLLSILGEGALAIENRRNALEKEQATVQAKNEEPCFRLTCGKKKHMSFHPQSPPLHHNFPQVHSQT